MTLFRGMYSPGKDSRVWVPFPSCFGSCWYKKLAADFERLVLTRVGFKPRLHSLERYLTVVIYSLLKRFSIHEAAEELNGAAARWFFKLQKKWPKRFKDGRKRRYFPHQTSINALLRRLPLGLVEMFFTEFFNAQLEELRALGLVPKNARLLVDNTRYPYYGTVRDSFVLGSNEFKGTKVGLFYQGAAALAGDAAFFVRFSPLEKNKPRTTKIAGDAQRLRKAKFEVLRVLVDREFYRVLLVRDLNRVNVDLLMPAKNSKAVRRRYQRYLRGKRGLVQPYQFSQTALRYPHQSSVRLRLVIIAMGNRKPSDVKDEWLPSPLVEKKCISQLRGFFTTIKPWKNEKAFSSYLRREYKKRWSVETAFRQLNALSPAWRTNSWSARLFYFGLKAVLYNIWQARRRVRLKYKNRLVPTGLEPVKHELLQELCGGLRKDFSSTVKLWKQAGWSAYDFAEKVYA